jgi:fused signal recognition particle receptor
MTSIFSKLKQALVGTSNKISSGIDHIFFKKKLDDKTLDELEDLLIMSDMSSPVAGHLKKALKAQKFDKEVSPEEIKTALSELIDEIFARNNNQFSLPNSGLNIVLVCGVNGNGKTTTVGKLAANYISQGKRVAIAACDTFRAAAVEQIAEWAGRAGALLIKGEVGTDPASVAYSAVLEAIDKQIDVLFIDTAGRLQNHKNLMEELAKIVKVIKKIDPSAPHHSLLVIDATTGQNAYSQVEQFSNMAGITGLVVTKLDGTAKAGVVVGLAQKFALPIYFIGVGEKVEDLRVFEAKGFSKALLGILR